MNKIVNRAYQLKGYYIKQSDADTFKYTHKDVVWMYRDWKISDS